MKFKDFEKMMKTNREHKNQFAKPLDAEALIKDSLKGNKLGKFKI